MVGCQRRRGRGDSGLLHQLPSTRRSPNDEWSAPENVGPVINTRFGDLTPTLSLDGRTLIFSEAAAARPGLGLQDIWMTTRTPSGQ